MKRASAMILTMALVACNSDPAAEEAAPVEAQEVLEGTIDDDMLPYATANAGEDVPEGEGAEGEDAGGESAAGDEDAASAEPDAEE